MNPKTKDEYNDNCLMKALIFSVAGISAASLVARLIHLSQDGHYLNIYQYAFSFAIAIVFFAAGSIFALRSDPDGLVSPRTLTRLPVRLKARLLRSQGPITWYKLYVAEFEDCRLRNEDHQNLIQDQQKSALSGK